MGVAFLGDRLLVSDGAFVSLLAPDGTRLAGPTLPVVEIAPGVELAPSSEFAVLEPDGTIRVFGIFFHFELPPSPDWPDRVDARVIAEIAGGGGARIVGVDGAGPTTMLATEDGRIRPFVDGQVGDPLVALDVPVTSATAAEAEWAVSTSGGVILMSDVQSGPLADAYPRPPSADNATVSRNGRLVVAGPRGTPGPFAIWDSSARQLVELPIPVDDTIAVGVYVDEEEVLEVFGYDSTRGDVQDEYRIGETGLEVARTPTEHDRYLASKGDQRVRKGFGSAGQELAYLGFVEPENGAIELPIPESPLAATFHPLRDWLLVGSDTGQAALYDTNTGDPVAGIDLSNESIAIGHWSRDGRLLATAAPAQGIAIRDGTTFETIRTMDLPSVGVGGWNFPALIFSADNSLLLTNVDGPGRLWDAATGEPIGTAFPNPIGNTGVNWGELPQLVTLTDQAILHWKLDTSTWGDVACTFAGSNLTQLEWEQWGPKDQPYHALCPQWPRQS